MASSTSPKEEQQVHESKDVWKKAATGRWRQGGTQGEQRHNSTPTVSTLDTTGYGGPPNELPTADELAPRRNPSMATPVRRFITPDSQSSSEYHVIDVKDCGTQTEGVGKSKTTLE